MFNNTEHNVKATADDPSGAVAHLLTNRRGIWFTFDLDMIKQKGGRQFIRHLSHLFQRPRLGRQMAVITELIKTPTTNYSK